jgi:hypothetical protein
MRRLRWACCGSHESGPNFIGKIQYGLAASIDPADPENAPAFNPLTAVGPAAGAALVYDVFDKAGWLNGDRMKTFFAHAVQVAAWHGLALAEIPRVLRDHEFREDLLDAKLETDPGDLYWQAMEYFQGEYFRFSDRDRDSSVAAIVTKFTDLLNSRLLARMFRARQNKVWFGSLFGTMPAAILVSIDTTGNSDLTSESASLVATLVVRCLFASAPVEAYRPVVLVADEFHNLGNSMEAAFRDVANMARARNVRLVLSTQHPGQLPERLRKDIATSSAVKAFFRPSDEDADVTAAALASVESSVWHARMRRVTPQDAILRAGHLDLTGGEPFETGRGHYEAYYLNRTRVLSTVPPAEVQARGFPAGPPPADPLPIGPHDASDALRRFCAFAWETVPPVCAKVSADTAGATPEEMEALGWSGFFGRYREVREIARRLPEGCASLAWKGGVGTLSVQRLVSPPPGVQERWRSRWKAELLSLRQGQAVVQVGTGEARRTDVTRVDPPEDAPEWWVSTAAMLFRAPEVPRPERVRRDWSAPRDGQQPRKERKGPPSPEAKEPEPERRQEDKAEPTQAPAPRWGDVPAVGLGGLGIETGDDAIVP